MMVVVMEKMTFLSHRLIKHKQPPANPNSAPVIFGQCQSQAIVTRRVSLVVSASYLLRRRDDCFVLKGVENDVDAHRFARLIVEVLHQRTVMLQPQQLKDVVVVVDGYLHQPHQLSGNGA